MNDESVQVALGAGAIVDLNVVDVRAGVQLGITEAAPDWRASLWVARAFALSQD